MSSHHGVPLCESYGPKRKLDGALGGGESKRKPDGAVGIVNESNLRFDGAIGTVADWNRKFDGAAGNGGGVLPPPAHPPSGGRLTTR